MTDNQVFITPDSSLLEPVATDEQLEEVVVESNQTVRVYLGGPISQLENYQLEKYQQALTKMLNDIATNVDITMELILPKPADGQSAEEIVCSDLYNIRTSDICVFCHCIEIEDDSEDEDDLSSVSYTRPSVGTSMEQMWAWREGNAGVIVWTNLPAKLSPWIISTSDAVCSTPLELAEAMEESLITVRDLKAANAELATIVTIGRQNS